MKKVLKYLGYTLQDCMRFMPAFPFFMLAMQIILALFSIWQPLVIAEIFEVVDDLNEINMRIFQRDIILLCLICGLPDLLGAVSEYFKMFLEAGKEQFYGAKMFQYAKRIKLETMEDAHTLDTFQKAEEAYTNYQAMVYLVVSLMVIVQLVVTCIGIIFVVGSFSMWLLPAAVFGVIPHFAITFLVNKKGLALYRAQTSIRRRAQYLWRQFCQKDSVKEMRTMGFGAYLKQKWVETNVLMVKEMEELDLSAARLYMLGAVIKNACYAFNVGIALVLMINGGIAVGQFAACITAFATLQSRLLTLESHMVDIFEIYHRVEEYYDFFELETEPDGTVEYHPFCKEITLKDVKFRYCGADTDSLNGVHLTIKKGEHVVIVGVNGSGKTTLSKILAGAYLPDSGSVLYDDQELCSLNRDSLYRNISIVSQDFIHYSFTLRENIGISNLSRIQDDAYLNKVIDSIELQELVQSIGGADTQLGREFNGQELSGGQWQKVAIARGLFKESDLIILDEPTSALDPLMEYDILTKFTKLTQGKTSVIISHRIGICRTADKVVVMKNGRVVECGTHETLKDAGGEYSRIWSEQAKRY